MQHPNNKAGRVGDVSQRALFHFRRPKSAPQMGAPARRRLGPSELEAHRDNLVTSDIPTAQRPRFSASPD